VTVVGWVALSVGTYQARRLGGVWFYGCVVSVGSSTINRGTGRLEYNYVACVNFHDGDAADYGEPHALHGNGTTRPILQGSARTLMKSLCLKHNVELPPGMDWGEAIPSVRDPTLRRMTSGRLLTRPRGARGGRGRRGGRQSDIRA
jgi:hypothetical protein